MELENEPDFFVSEAGQLGIAKLHGVFAGDEDAALGIEGMSLGIKLRRPIEAAQQIEERALARAAGADDGDIFLVEYLQVDAFEDVIDRIIAAQELVKVLGAQQCSSR